MLAEVLPIVDNAFSFKERSSNMDSNCAVEELSDTLQSCEPFSVTDNDTCKSLVAPDIPVTEVLAGAFNSISIVESSGQRDDEGKSNDEFYVPSKHKCPNGKCSSPPRRSAQISKSNQKTKQRKSGKKLGKTTVKKPLLDTVLLTMARKTRTYVCKPTRTSLWGSLGYISQIFQQSTGVDVGQIEHTKSLKARASQGSGKRNKNHSRRSKGNSCSVSGRIRLKVTLGKEVVQSCLTNMVSDIDNGFRNDWGNTIEDHGLTDGSEYKLKEEEPGSHGFHCCNLDQEKVVMLSDSHLEVCNANKNLEIPVIIEKLAGVNVDNHQRVPSQIEFEGSEVAGDNLYLDSGTSPDSEVINLIPEAQVNRNVQEDLHDVLIPSQARVAPGDITSLDLPEMSSKKGKKMDKLPCAGSFIVEDRFPSPEVVNKATVLEKWGQGENTGDCFYSREASLSTAVTEDLCTRLDDGLESRESHISEKFRPYTKTKGQKHSKSSKSRGLRKSGSEVSDSPKSRRGHAFRQKGNPAKLVSRRKGDDNGAFDEVVCKVENQQETGDHSSDDPAKTKAGNEITTKDMFNLNMVPRVVGEQYLPARNAWVCCDDCFKWRRIPARLADSIEETNCRWTCKDNMDEGFADCSIPQEKSNAEINAELEISDASCEEDARDVRLNSKRLDPKHLTVHQQSTWMLIKSNLFLHRSRKTQTIDEIMVCHCKPPPNGRMGCGDGCLNRMLNIECVQGTCPCGEICSNQQFQKHKYAKLTWFRCGKKGYGLQSLEAISKGQFLIEYVGEVLDMQAYEARQREYASMGHKHFYFMTLNGSEVIDACAKGNLGRFINHSCDPNCRTEKWMVNGEVCIGLFALRDIKKGEEVTFDYNYVRVFGAAVKKCVCGSSQCRGYIGGDPVNTEVIVQGDSDEEYPEPVMCYEDGEIDDNVKHLISSTTSVDGKEMQIADNILGNKHKMDISTIAVGHLESTAELQTTKIFEKDKNETDKSVTSGQHSEITTGNSSNKSESGARLKISLEIDNPEVKLSPSVLQVETSSQLDDVSSKTIFNVQQEFVQRLETSALKVMSSKSLSDTIDTKKCKSDTIEGRHTSKSRPLMKTSRSSSSVKKGKSNSNPVNVHKSEMVANKSHVLPYKPKKIMEGSLSGRFEAVEEKLNELLDVDGGVSKRKDATKGYLKLLLLTATSGDSGNGEAIQSNRDLSMILDGLLKTKSRMVLVDIINKNGLQMLHNIMKRYRRDFKKIPILRKLLKVLEYLAMREILTLEHITGGPHCPGMESFMESILNLTEHDDKQVHQIARNFRDRWIPKSARKSSSMDKSDGRVEFQRGLNCNAYSESQNHWCDYGVKTTEAIDCVKQSIVATNPVDTGTVESCSASCSSGCPTSGTRIRKRKSRWDQPAEIKTDVLLPPHKEPKIEPSLLQKSHSGSQAENGQAVLDHINGINTDDKQGTGCIHNLSLQMENRADDGGQNIDEDVPPGFSPLSAPSVPSSASSAVIDVHRDNGIPAKFPCEVVMGHPPRRFINRQAVSYGIPLPVVQQFGIPPAETLESWIVAPGMPFHPFPPLPSYPRDKRESPPCAGNTVTKNEHAGCERGNYRSSVRQSDQHAPSTSGASLPNMETRGANNHRTFQRGGRGNNGLGRRYFKQQKWNNSELGPPWFRNRNSWGNNLRNGMCSSIGVASVANEIRGPISSANASTGVDGACNTFHQYPQHQNWHY